MIKLPTANTPIGGFSRPLLLAAMIVAALPSLAQADTIVTFNWVPASEKPTTYTTTPQGSITFDLSSFAYDTTPPGSGTNYGPYYTSGSAIGATVTAFSYTAGDGLSVGLSNLSSTSITALEVWATSALDTASKPSADPFAAPTMGYYLTSAFSLSGTTAQGSAFSVSNTNGTAGATYANGIPNGAANFNATTSGTAHAATADGGYWELATPVPLPGGLTLLLSGLGGLGFLARKKFSARV